MKRLFLAILACLGLNTAMAGEANLSWTPPTQNTDGSTLTDLAGYTLFYGTTAGSLNQTVNIPNPSQTLYQVQGLANGTWFFGIAAYNIGGVSSGMSNIVSKTVADPSKPMPPANFKTVSLNVYQILQTPNSFTLLPVGTVPNGTSCDPNYAVASKGTFYYAIDTAKVSWFGSVKPKVVVGSCG